jgi:hypothetical protein
LAEGFVPAFLNFVTLPVQEGSRLSLRTKPWYPKQCPRRSSAPFLPFYAPYRPQASATEKKCTIAGGSHSAPSFEKRLKGLDILKLFHQDK